MFPTKFKINNFKKYIIKAPEVIRSAGVRFNIINYKTSVCLMFGSISQQLDQNTKEPETVNVFM
jgi:hypothetical protein